MNIFHLYAQDTKLVTSKEAIRDLNQVLTTGHEQVQHFYKQNLLNREVPITDTIPKNGYLFFTQKKSRTSSKVGEKLKMAKSDVALFSRLFISCQARQGNLEPFFAYENQSFPPSLSEKDNLKPAKSKSDVIDSILQIPYGKIRECPPIEVKICDGPALVNMLPPSNCKNFLDYSCEVFVPYL